MLICLCKKNYAEKRQLIFKCFPFYLLAFLPFYLLLRYTEVAKVFAVVRDFLRGIWAVLQSVGSFVSLSLSVFVCLRC